MALETFGKRLRVSRIDKDLSQIALRDQMEKLYGVSIGETYISELERTERMPTLEVAAAMAQVLDMSLDYLGLLIGDAVSFRRQPPPDNFFSEEADEVAKMVDGMHPEQRLLLLNLAKNMPNLLNQRQRERAEIRDLLDSVQHERTLGLSVRRELEKLMRSKGMLGDDAP